MITLALASNSTKRLNFWLEDLEKKLYDPHLIEVLVAVHNAPKWETQFPKNHWNFSLFFKESLSEKGYFDLHRDYQNLFHERSSTSYFFAILSDTAYFSYKNWDQALITYTNYTPHNFFVVTFSNNRYMNYTTITDVWHFPDNFSFFTTDFIEAVGGIGPFWAPDAWIHSIIYHLNFIKTKTNRGRNVVFRDINLRIPIKYPYFIYRNKEQFPEYQMIRLSNVYNKFHGEIMFYKQFLSWKGFHHIHHATLSLMENIMQRTHTPLEYYKTKNPILIIRTFPFKLWLYYQWVYVKKFFYLPFYILSYYIFRLIIKSAFFTSLCSRIYYFLLKNNLYKTTLGYRLTRYFRLIKLWRKEYLLEAKDPLEKP